jgi:hypothetical protein
MCQNEEKMFEIRKVSLFLHVIVGVLYITYLLTFQFRQFERTFELYPDLKPGKFSFSPFEFWLQFK